MSTPDITSQLTFVELETSSACARRCTWCPTGLGLRPRDQVLIEWGLFEKILIELADVGYTCELSLHGLNEPLQNERLFDEYALARRLLPGARLTCYTNGDRLRHEELDALREAGVDRVRVTLHAAPGQLGRSDSRRLSFFLNRFGIDESRCEALDDSESVRRDFRHGDMVVEVTQPIVAAHFNDRGGLVASELSLPSARQSPCDATATALAISYTGRLKMCCNISEDAPDHSRYLLADLRNTSLLESYMSARSVQLRERHAAADWSQSPVCVTCRHRTGVADHDLNEGR